MTQITKAEITRLDTIDPPTFRVSYQTDDGEGMVDHYDTFDEAASYLAAVEESLATHREEPETSQDDQETTEEPAN